MVVRLAVALVVVAVVVVVNALYRARRRRIVTDVAPVPNLPAHLVDGADRTWVVFTTPWCASCGPVTERLQAHDPAARVVKVDATAEPALADSFRIRSAPTVLLADRDGEVRERLVGAAAVDGYVRQASNEPKPAR